MNKPFAPLSREEIAIRALGLRRDPLAGELIALEPRMVFDGAGVAIVADAAKQASDTSDTGQTDSTAKSAAELTKMMAAASVPPTPAAPAPVEVVFIDSRVSDIDAFKKTAGDNRLIVVVDAQDDGITKITDTLKGLHDISAVHIVGHGVEGSFELGKNWIGVDAIKAHEADINSWTQSLAVGADILLYGCDVAKGTDGETLIKTLAQETGRDVAASADAVGLTDYGADWTLEKTTGVIEAKVLAPENYAHELAVSADVSLSYFVDDQAPSLVNTGSTKTNNLTRGTTYDNTKNWTNDVNPAFGGGGAVAGAVVRIYAKDSSSQWQLAGSTIAASDGSFTITVGTFAAVDQSVATKLSALPATSRVQMRVTQQAGTDGESTAASANSNFYMNIDTAPPDALGSNNAISAQTSATFLSQSTTNGVTDYKFTANASNARFTISLTTAQRDALIGSGGQIVSYRFDANGNVIDYYAPGLTAVTSTTTSLVFFPMNKGNYTNTGTNGDLSANETYHLFLVDGAGNFYNGDGTKSTLDVATQKSALTITINLIQPGPPGLTTLSDNVGQSQSINISGSPSLRPSVDDNTPTFTGTGLTSGRSLNLQLLYTPPNGVLRTVYNKVVSANAEPTTGIWNYTLEDLAATATGAGDGMYTVNFAIIDTGVSSPAATYNFYLDRSSPSFHLEDASGPVQKSTLSVKALVDGISLVSDTGSWKAPGSTLTVSVIEESVLLLRDAQNQLVETSGGFVTKTYTVTVNSLGGWALSIPVADLGTGRKNISATVTDSNGLVSSLSSPQSVFVTSSWSPGGLGTNGLAVWYDPSQAPSDTITAVSANPSDGYYVKLLRDLSGNKSDATQSTTANQPILKQDTTGRWYIDFTAALNANGSVNSGSTKFLSLPSAVNVKSLVYAGQISVSNDSTSTTQDASTTTPFNSSTTGTTGNNFGFFSFGGTSPTGYGLAYTVTGANVSNYQVSAAPISGQPWVIATAVNLATDSASGRLAGTINGVSGSSGPNYSSGSTVFALIGSIGSRFTGQLSSIIAYNNRVLSSAETTILSNMESQQYVLPLASTVSDLFVVKGGTTTSEIAAQQLKYSNNVGGILNDGTSRVSTAGNGGLIITDSSSNSFLATSNTSIMFGDDGSDAKFQKVTVNNTENPGITRFARSWAVDVSGGNGGKVDVSFDVASLASQAGETWDKVVETYQGRKGMSLAWRASESVGWQVIATSDTDVVASGGKITFAGVDVSATGLRDGFVTLMDGPTVRGITNSASGTVIVPTTTFRVEFSESVAKLTTSNFSLKSTSPDTGNAPRVLSIAGDTTGTTGIKSFYDSASGKYYVDVTVSVGSGSGDLTLDYNFAGFDTINPTGVDEGTLNADNAMVKTAYTTSPVAFNYNLTAPTIDSFKDDVGIVEPDTAASGTFTDDTLPLLKGTAAANTQVNIYLDGSTTILASVNSDSNGLWSYQVTSALAEGARKFSAKTQDSLGNLSSSSSDFTINVDVTAPAKPTLALANDTGTNTNDYYSTNGRINVTNVESTGTWQYSTDGGTTWSVKQASSVGFFTLTPGDYLGSTAVAVRQIDAAGNVSQSTILPETHIDVTRPSEPGLSLNSDTGSSSSDLITKDNIIKVTGLEDGASWEYKIGSGAWTAGSGATFTLSTDGTYAIGDLQVRQTDKAGNLSDAGSNAAAIKLDRVAPTYGAQLSFTSGTLTSGNSTLTYIRQTSWRIDTLDPIYGYAADEKPQISIDGGFTFVDLRPVRQNNGVYYYFWDFNDGDVFAANKVVLQVVDAAGNIKSGLALPTKYVVDITPPSVPVITGFTDNVGNLKDNFTTANVTTDDPTPTFYGTSEAGSTVYVRYNLIKADGSFGPGVIGSVTLGATQTNWSYTPSANMASGSYSVVAYAVDIAGNTGLTSDSFFLSVDTTTPAVPVIRGFVDDIGNVTSTSASPSASGVTTDDTSPLLVGTAGGAGRVDIYEGGNKIGSAIVDTSSTTKTWSYQLTGVTAGTHNYTAKYVNAAGSESAETTAFTIKVDTSVVSAPTFVLNSDTGLNVSDLVTKDAKVNVSGIATGSTWAWSKDGGNSWTSSLASTVTSFNLPEGEYDIGKVVVKQTGVNGSEASTSNTAKIKIDLTNPAYTFIDTVDGSGPNDTAIGRKFYTGLFKPRVYEPDAKLEFSINGTTWTEITSADKSFTIPDGTYTEGMLKLRQTDLAGNISDPWTNTGSTVQAKVYIIESTPTVTGLSLTATGGQNNYLNAGDIVTVTASFSQAVTVSGGPLRIVLNVGGVEQYATYAGGSGTSSLTFTYTIASGDTDSNGISIDANKLERNGATLIGSSGNNVVLDHAAVSDNAALKVDTVVVAPTLGLASDTGSFGTDGITSNGQINVSGVETGGTWQYSTNGGGTWSIAQAETVTSFTLSAGTYSASMVQVRQTDAAGNLSSIASISTALTIDTQAPTLALSTSATSLKAGEFATITFTLSEAVTGLDVSDFDVTNGSLSNLVQSTTDPKVYTATFTPKTSFNGTGKIEFKTTGAFADIAGNAGNAQSVTSGPLTFALDTTAASISSVALTSQTGAQNNYLNEGDTVTATVTFSEAVNVTGGTPQLAFKIGNDTKYAIYKSGSGTSSLTFTYSIGAGETDTNGISLDASVLTLNGAAITTKSSGNSVVLGHAPVADNATYRVDTTKPDAPVLALGTGVADGATSAEATATGGVVTLTAESGSSVVVTFTNGMKTITKNVTGNGATPVAALLTTADLASLGDGTVSVSAKATDLAGNESDAGSTSFTLDTVKPTKPVLTPGPGVDDGATGEEAKQDKGVVTVTADPDTDVTVTFTNGTKKVTKTVKGGGTTPVPVILTQDDINTLGDGPITVSAISKDAAGNDSDGGTASFTLDTVAPKLTVTSSATALKIGETAILTFEASEELLDLTADDFNVTHGTLSNFVRSSTNPIIFTATFTPEAGFEGQGGVTLNGSFTDKAGNAGSLNSFAGIAIDTNSPAVALTSYDDNVDPQSGNFALSTPTNDTTPTFNGTGEAGANVELFRRDGANLISLGTTTIVNGKWSITPGSALGEGTYQIFARVMDSAGNSADTANSTLVIDQGTSGKLDGFDDGTGTPDVAKPFDGPAQSSDVKFVGEAEKGARVDVYRRDGNKIVLIGSGTSDPLTGKYSVRNSVSLAEGDSTIFVRITDAAGNSVDTADAKLTISLPRAPSASPEPVVVTTPPEPVIPAVFPKPEAQTDNQVSSTFGVPLGSVFDVKTVNSVVVTVDGKAFRRDVTGSIGDAASPIQQIPAVEYASYLRPAFVEVGILVRERGAAFVQAREDLPQIDAVKVTSRPEVAPYIEDTKTGRILVRRDGPAEVRMEIEITMRDGTVIRQQIRVDTKSGQFTVNSPDGAWLMPQSLDQQLAGLLWGDVAELADLFAEEIG